MRAEKEFSNYRELPEWLFDALSLSEDLSTETPIIDYSDNKFYLINTNTSVYEYDDLYKLRLDLRAITGKNDLVFSYATREFFELNDNDHTIFATLPNGVKIVVQESSDVLRYDRLADVFDSWLEIYEKYKLNPDSFENSLLFFKHHPATWVRENDDLPFNWLTDVGLSCSNMSLDVDSMGAVSYTFSATSHDDSFLMLFEGADVIVTSDSSEGAVVGAATEFDKLFNKFGFRVLE